MEANIISVSCNIIDSKEINNTKINDSENLIRKQLMESYESTGDSYMIIQKWKKASKYYKKQWKLQKKWNKIVDDETKSNCLRKLGKTFLNHDEESFHFYMKKAINMKWSSKLIELKEIAYNWHLELSNNSNTLNFEYKEKMECFQKAIEYGLMNKLKQNDLLDFAKKLIHSSEFKFAEEMLMKWISFQDYNLIDSVLDMNNAFVAICLLELIVNGKEQSLIQMNTFLSQYPTWEKTEYYSFMKEIISKYQGTVEKWLGDIMESLTKIKDLWDCIISVIFHMKRSNQYDK
jgi:tetratricopeptide (TPR) repeat protein